jgi:hypothetical protein
MLHDLRFAPLEDKGAVQIVAPLVADRVADSPTTTRTTPEQRQITPKVRTRFHPA